MNHGIDKRDQAWLKMAETIHEVRLRIMRELHEKRLHSPDTFALDARWDTTSFVSFLRDCYNVALMICWC